MLFAADENFYHTIIRCLRRRSTDVSIITVQENGLSGTDHPGILEWAAKLNRVLLTLDVTSMSVFTFERVTSGKRIPGVFEIGRHVPIHVAIDDLFLIAEYSLGNEWEGQVLYLPLR